MTEITSPGEKGCLDSGLFGIIPSPPKAPPSPKLDPKTPGISQPGVQVRPLPWRGSLGLSLPPGPSYLTGRVVREEKAGGGQLRATTTPSCWQEGREKGAGGVATAPRRFPSRLRLRRRRRRGRCRGSGGPSRLEEVPASPSPGSETRGLGRSAPPSLPPSLLSVSPPLRLCRPWARQAPSLPPATSSMSHESSRRGEERSGGSLKRHRSHSESLPGGSSGGGSKGLGRKEQKRKKREVQQIQQIQHLESFYEKLPPGLIKENETKPEDCIPDVPGNENAREFLAHAPTKGLWMPLGKEVKVMQCWRCKRYGHRTGDKECPFFIKGNQKLEQFRVAHEDPMYDIIRENKRHEKEMRIQQLKQLLEDSTSDEDSSSESSSSSGGKERHKKKKKEKKKKKKKKKRKHKSSKSDRRSESD